MNPPDLFSPEFAKDPYPFYAIMRREHPLFFHEKTGSYVLSRHDDVARALGDPVFSTRNYEWQLQPVHGRTIMQKEGRELANHRSLVTSSFRGSDLYEKHLPRIRAAAKELVDTFRGAGEVELVSAFTTRFPLNVVVDMLGLPKADRARFHAWHVAILGFVANLTKDPAIAEAGLRARDELRAYVMPLIKARREKPGDDLLSALCAAADGGWRLADDEVAGFCGTLLGAGGSTTDKGLASLLKNLVEHPDALDQVRRDRSLIDRAFAETLRYSPPLHVILRVPTEDVTMSGGTIPANSTVTCLLGAANRDEGHFERPDEFDIHRKEIDVERAFTGRASHVAFGQGRHFCVGAVLAKVEAQVAVNTLLDAMLNIRFVGGAPPEVGLFSRAPKALHLKFDAAGE